MVRSSSVSASSPLFLWFQLMNSIDSVDSHQTINMIPNRKLIFFSSSSYHFSSLLVLLSPPLHRSLFDLWPLTPVPFSCGTWPVTLCFHGNRIFYHVIILFSLVMLAPLSWVLLSSIQKLRPLTPLSFNPQQSWQCLLDVPKTDSFIHICLVFFCSAHPVWPLTSPPHSRVCVCIGCVGWQRLQGIFQLLPPSPPLFLHLTLSPSSSPPPPLILSSSSPPPPLFSILTPDLILASSSFFFCYYFLFLHCIFFFFVVFLFLLTSCSSSCRCGCGFYCTKIVS